MSKAIFLTGTGTDIGKTFIAGLIVKKLAQAGKNPAYYKAAMSGNDRRPDGSLIPGDALFVRQMSGISQPLGEMCPYVYENAWSQQRHRQRRNPIIIRNRHRMKQLQYRRDREPCHRRQSQREEAYLEVLHHQRQPGLMRNFRAFCQVLHFRQEMEPGPYMYVTWRKIPKEPSRMPECRQQV